MPRRPAVAGQFYPAGKAELESMLKQFITEEGQKQHALGVLSPHAGYVFCGAVAGKAFGSIHVPEAVVLLNPSHYAYQPPFALWTGDSWQTPLGEVALHEGICSALAELPFVTSDNAPHSREHSGEVVLPFLQYQRPDVKIAVICITSSARLADLQQLGSSIAEIVRRCGEEDALVVASSDMSHESGPAAEQVVRKNDPKAIQKMEQLDPEGLHTTCRTERITMCGVLPAVAMMESVRARGGTKGVLLAQATSADSPYGRGEYVVGYAGMIFT